MLKITASQNLETRTFKLEGRLVGLWVKELERCWHEAASGTRADSIRVELVAVTFVDIAGRELLRLMIRHGAQVVGADCLTKGIIDQLSVVRSEHDGKLSLGDCVHARESKPRE